MSTIEPNNQEEAPSLENLVSVYAFAADKGVTGTAVYDAIKAGKIVPYWIGSRKMIDKEKYANIEFPNAKRHKKDKK